MPCTHKIVFSSKFYGTGEGWFCDSCGHEFTPVAEEPNPPPMANEGVKPPADSGEKPNATKEAYELAKKVKERAECDLALVGPRGLQYASSDSYVDNGEKLSEVEKKCSCIQDHGPISCLVHSPWNMVERVEKLEARLEEMERGERTWREWVIDMIETVGDGPYKINAKKAKEDFLSDSPSKP